MPLTGGEASMRLKLCAVYRCVCAFFRPDQGRPPHFPKVVYLDCVYN